jgi:hypothetical protein
MRRAGGLSAFSFVRNVSLRAPVRGRDRSHQHRLRQVRWRDPRTMADGAGESPHPVIRDSGCLTAAAVVRHVSRWQQSTTLSRSSTRQVAQTCNLALRSWYAASPLHFRLPRRVTRDHHRGRECDDRGAPGCPVPFRARCLFVPGAFRCHPRESGDPRRGNWVPAPRLRGDKLRGDDNKSGRSGEAIRPKRRRVYIFCPISSRMCDHAHYNTV